MTVVTWSHKGEAVKDYFLFSWLLFSRHLENKKTWMWAFHLKGHHAWYNNFKRHYHKSDNLAKGFTHTRLTLRLGRYIVVIGNVDTEAYYRNVLLLKMVCRGKVVFDIKEAEAEAEREGQYALIAKTTAIATLEKMYKNFHLLSKDYPAETWRN
jgi:hypothetical protein